MSFFSLSPIRARQARSLHRRFINAAGLGGALAVLLLAAGANALIGRDVAQQGDIRVADAASRGLIVVAQALDDRTRQAKVLAMTPELVAAARLKDGKSAVVCEQGQLYKLSKSKVGVVTRERLTKTWTDWVDYWAVDFNYQSRKEIIKVQRGMGIEGHLPGIEPVQGELPVFEDRWTGGFIFENEWQSFRTRQNRELEMTTAEHTYEQPGRYTVAVKVIDIFGNDTMTLVPVNVG